MTPLHHTCARATPETESTLTCFKSGELLLVRSVVRSVVTCSIFFFTFPIFTPGLFFSHALLSCLQVLPTACSALLRLRPKSHHTIITM